VSKEILPYPFMGNGTDTPTPTRPIPAPAEISAALTLIGAEQVAPGVWTATLSIGVTIRVTDPAALGKTPCARCGLADASICPCLCDCESYDCTGECCGRGNCSCTPLAVRDAG
jgi:hypothetical protein